MSVHTTLETVSASLHAAAEQVKKLQSISGPSDIISAVKELTAPLQSIAKEIAQVKKDVESIKDNNLLCLQELKKQTAAAEKHAAVAERQAKLSKNLLRATIQSENGQFAFNTNVKRGVSGMLRFPPSTINEDDPPYECCPAGVEGLSLENLKVLAKYYGASVDETTPKNVYNHYNFNPESELKKRYRDALYNDLNVK
jgi:hypothetical protein